MAKRQKQINREKAKSKSSTKKKPTAVTVPPSDPRPIPVRSTLLRGAPAAMADWVYDLEL